MVSASLNRHDVIFVIFLLLQSIRVSIFYELELDFKLSFRVRIRFKIRKNNVMSVWQQVLTFRGGHLGTPNSSSPIQLYRDQWTYISATSADQPGV